MKLCSSGNHYIKRYCNGYYGHKSLRIRLNEVEGFINKKTYIKLNRSGNCNYIYDKIRQRISFQVVESQLKALM